MTKVLDGNRTLTIIGGLLLGYALLGNYVALPGYLRFLERGGVSQAGNMLDLYVVIGAIKTIAWMFSFQVGVLCLAVAHARKNSLLTRYIGVGGIVWLVLWSWPTLPAPGPIFYIALGASLLISIGVVLNAKIATSDDETTRTMFLGSLMFFAFATWEVCGLGTTGRMLHPEEAQKPMAHNLLITQSSKLMVEFVIAWGLLAASLVRTRFSNV
jgi:hypothetical protein